MSLGFFTNKITLRRFSLSSVQWLFKFGKWGEKCHDPLFIKMGTTLDALSANLNFL